MDQISCQPLRTTTTHLIDPELLTETMREYFGIQLRPMARPMCKKLYLEWVNRTMPLPEGYIKCQTSLLFLVRMPNQLWSI